jgi:hypothetical protein
MEGKKEIHTLKTKLHAYWWTSTIWIAAIATAWYTGHFRSAIVLLVRFWSKKLVP